MSSKKGKKAKQLELKSKKRYREQKRQKINKWWLGGLNAAILLVAFWGVYLLTNRKPEKPKERVELAEGQEEVIALVSVPQELEEEQPEEAEVIPLKQEPKLVSKPEQTSNSSTLVVKKESGKPPKSKPSHEYLTINGIKYERDLMEAADEFVEGRGDGRISNDDFSQLVELAEDGTGITSVELRTLRYIGDHKRFTSAAKRRFQEELGNDFAKAAM